MFDIGDDHQEKDRLLTLLVKNVLLLKVILNTKLGKIKCNLKVEFFN